ncbi:MAG: histidine phosphatase family protein [Ottowia sp.]|nr:histidine phosphatase family protein [Ottowia sp.]
MNTSSPSSARRVFFVRHGQSSSNAGELSVPHAEVPLTALGLAQSIAVAPLLPARPALVLTSPYVRAQETAAPYCAHCGVQMHEVDLLHEFDAFAFHLIEGMTGEQRRPVTAEFWGKADPLLRTGKDKETFTEFATRVQAFEHIVLPVLPSDTVIFGHGTWIALMVWRLLGFNPLCEGGMRRFRSFQQGLPMPNASIWCLQELAAGQWRVQMQEEHIHTIREHVEVWGY